MTNLSKSFRKLVKDNFIINALVLSQAQVSKDRTIKNTFLLADGSVVEGC